MRCHALTLVLLLPLACAGDDEATAGDSTSSTSTSTTSADTEETTGAEAVCGDGILVWPEVCDDGQETVNCDGDCSGPAVCGDGYVNAAAGEVCDDGNVSNEDSCLATCVVASCGDGYVQAGVEVCDDGNKVDNDGCSADCSEATVCGDGIVDDGEDCDDAGESESCNDDCTAAACADGVLNVSAGEQCDDGNEKNGDGCNNGCQIEAGCGEAFTTKPCPQSGLDLDQSTSCGGIDWSGNTCYGPLIHYGDGEKVGKPVRSGDDEFMAVAVSSWCISLGFSGAEDVAYGTEGQCDGSPEAAAHPVVWADYGDESNWHWADLSGDGKWYPPEPLNEEQLPCPVGDVIHEVTCTP